MFKAGLNYVNKDILRIYFYIKKLKNNKLKI